MKKITLLLTFILSSVVYAQDVVMHTGTVNQCSGTLYDSGGPGGNYSSNENYVLTICPENPGQRVQLDFTEFATQLNQDILTIYNGDSTAADAFGEFSGAFSPAFVSATEDNTSGCITLEFISNASGVTSGWVAAISCMTPCQIINSQVDSSVPAPNALGYIRVCPDEDITLNGSGTFSVDGAGASYEWDLGDGNTASGQSVTFSYPNPGVYIVNLNIRDTNTSIDPNGCTNNNLINQVIQVATEPDFTGTQAAQPVICFGESTTIPGIVTPVEFINDCTPPVSGTTFLPDGSGVSYETSVTVDCYDSAQTLSDISQLVSICITMEHSYLGDLNISIISPNGQQVTLHNYPSGGSANLGIPWATNPVDGQSGNTTPGVGYQYCFIPGNTYPTLVGGIQSGGVFPSGNGPGTYTDSYVPAGNYSSYASLNGLLGSPLNGNWTIRIVDNLGADNGYIFEWSITFDPNLQPPELSFTPVIVDEGWDPDPSIINTTGTTITVQPATAGTHCYTYRATDDFGCDYFEEVCIQVQPEIIYSQPNNLYLCNPGAPPYIFDLELNTPVVLGSTSNPEDYVVTYHLSQEDADDDVGAIDPSDAYEGTNGEVIYVRIEYMTSGCYAVESFTLNITSQPILNSVPDIEVCDGINNDGFAEFDLESRTLGILGGQSSSDFVVTYHTSYAGADSGTGGLVSPYTNIAANQPIYVRIEQVNDASCNNVSVTPMFLLIVNPSDEPFFTLSPTCDGGTATVTGTSGGTFTFNPAPSDGAVINSATGLVTGGTSGASYTIEYTTAGICPQTGTQVLTVETTDDSSFTMTATCDGGTASVTGTPGGIFSFDTLPADGAVIDPATGTVTGGTSGTGYTVRYTTNGVCPESSTQGVTVTITDNPSFTLTATCDGATATITGTPGGSFAFNPLPSDGAVINTGTGTITGGSSGTGYTIEYTTNGTCPASSTEVVTVLLTDDAGFTITPTCDGGTASVTGTPGGTFSFANPQPSDGAVIDPATGEVTGGTPSAVYTVQYTTGGVCASGSVQTLNVLPVDNAGFTVSSTCDGGIATVTGLPGGTFSFSTPPSDAAVINPATGEVTSGTPGAGYTITYTTGGTCPNTSEVTFSVYPLPLVIDPAALEVCDDNIPDGITEIDLTLKNTEITGNTPGSIVSYYLTQAAAEAGDPATALAIPYTNISNPQIVYVRVENATTGCYATTTLELVVEQAPVANIPAPLEYCDPDIDGFGVFDIAGTVNEITGGVAGLTVTFHETLTNAENGIDALSSPYSNIVAQTQTTIYVRVESSTIATDCATIVPLELIVNPAPQVPNVIAPLVICDDASSDGFAQFDLTVKNAEILGSQSLSDFTLTYHVTEDNAQTGANPILNDANYTNTSNPQTIYVRLVSIANGCVTTGQFDIRVELPPAAIQPSPLELCDDATADSFTSFDLTVKNIEITGGEGSWAVSYYLTSADAQSNNNAISPATSYTNTSNPQTLFVRVTDTDTGCVSFVNLTLRVLPNPTPSPDPQDLVLCDDVNTGDGQEAFDLTLNQAYILNGEPGVTPSYHISLEDAEAGINAIADPTQHTNSNTDYTPETIYVRVTNDITGCYTIVDFDILVNPLPQVVAVTDYIICELNNDGMASFDLTGKNAEVLNGQDPSIFAVSYHTSQANADNLTNSLISPYVNTVNPQLIYVAITNTLTGCSVSTQVFNIEVQEAAQANSDGNPILYELCDNIGGNDGFGQFDLTTQNPAVLDGQDPANYIVTYYATEADAESGVNPIPTLYENITNPQVIYARVDNNTPDGSGNDTSICYAVTALTLQVNLLPVFDLDDAYTLCIDTNGTEVVNPPVLDTGLNESDYSFEWILNGVVLAETSSSITATEPGTYSVLVTNITTGCQNSDSAEVEASSPPVLVAEVVTQAFSENHVIEAAASGSGVYEYSLDGGPWQSSGTFTNVSFGEHIVTARDTEGCGLVSVMVMVMDYPKFFTPNGDGYHDTWNIVGIANQPSAKIYIFDRYGKLLKQLSPSGEGWNGTYNGEPMPTSDYWFTVEYNEPSTGHRKEFKAHFTLKR